MRTDDISITRSKRVNKIILCYTVQDEDQFHAKVQVRGSHGLSVMTYIDMACIIMYCQDP